MMQQELLPLDEAVPMQASRGAPAAPAANDIPRKWKVAFVVGSALMVVNLVVLSAILIEMKSAKNSMADAQQKYEPMLNDVAELGAKLKPTAALLSAASAFLNGNIPDTLNKIIRSDFNKLAVTVANFTGSVEAALGPATGDPAFPQVQQYTALVNSIAQVTTSWQTITDPSTAPPPGSDEGFLGILDSIEHFLQNQTSIDAVKRLGGTCTQATSQLLKIDWSGAYKVPSSPNFTGRWSANGMKETVVRVQNFCVMAQQVDPVAIRKHLARMAEERKKRDGARRAQTRLDL